MDDTYSMIHEANKAGYIVGMSGVDDNACGIEGSHAYTVLDSFTMADSEQEYEMLVIRNPWGVTYYSYDWNEEDPAWTEEMIN